MSDCSVGACITTSQQPSLLAALYLHTEATSLVGSSAKELTLRVLRDKSAHGLVFRRYDRGLTVPGRRKTASSDWLRAPQPFASPRTRLLNLRLVQRSVPR